MKRLILGSLSLLLFSTATAPAFGDEKTAINPVVSTSSTQSNITRIEPNELVNLAYQGYFTRQGIPSYGDLVLAFSTDKITAKDIVQSAVNARKLPLQVLNDEEYLNAVENQVEALNSNGAGIYN